MDIFGGIEFFGGLALFLYGMVLLSSGLERISGGKLEKTLERLTNTVFKGVLLGALVTAAIQSSSATTVIVVGLVNSKILKLRNAIGVVMGANIGTTITAHILRLSDIESANILLSFLETSTLAPLACMVGAAFVLLNSRGKKRDIGIVLLGFGILFTGMLTMSGAVKPLAESELFLQAFEMFAEMPALGILTGTIVTAVLQSSSASVGILQALSTTGVISFAMAFPIIMGQNIGTTITPVLASIGASKNAKRSAAVHVIFNILGTFVFLLAFYFIHYVIYPFAFFNDTVTMGTIANFHTVFNVCVTLLFIPFVGLLEKAANAIIKVGNDAESSTETTVILDKLLYKSPALAIDQSRESILYMAEIAKSNLIDIGKIMVSYDKKVAANMRELEDVADRMQDKTENYLIELSEYELSDNDSRKISKLVHIGGEFERIADHSIEILSSIENVRESKMNFSKKAQEELKLFTDANLEIVELAIKSLRDIDTDAARRIMPLEAIIDVMEETLREKHLERLKKGKCSVELAFPFNEILRSIERVGDLCSNISESLLSYESDKLVDRHEYKIKLSETAEFKVAYAEYKDKYVKPLKKI